MAEKPLLKDLCRANKGGLSYRKIAELSGVPENTVNNFFSSASKDPSIYTAGPICRVCNVSLNGYFDIKIPGEHSEQTHRIEQLAHRIELLENDKAALLRENTIYEKANDRRDRAEQATDRLIYCLVFVLSMTIVALVPYIFADMNNPTFGLWRGGSSVVGAVVIVALTAGVAVTVYMFIVSRKERRGK